MAYVAWSVIFGEVPSASKWNLLGANDAAFNSGGGVLGSGLATDAITLGYAQITSIWSATVGSTAVDVTGLSVTVTIPSGGRRIKVTAYSGCFYSAYNASNYVNFQIRNDSGTLLAYSSYYQPVANNNIPGVVFYSGTPSAGSATYKVTVNQNNSATLYVGAGATYPAFILVELV
jgi:hypothetical protein